MTPHLEKIVALGASVLTIAAPKFCCWSSAIAAVGSGVSYLAWVYPLRPYLWALSFMMLGYSFYKTYKPKKFSCESCAPSKRSFLQSKLFVWITGIVVLLVFALNYSK